MKRHLLEAVWVVSIATSVGFGCGGLTVLVGRLGGVQLLAENGFAIGFAFCLAAFIFRKWRGVFLPAPEASHSIK